MAEGSSEFDEWLVNSVHEMSITNSDSVSQWLEDLRLMADTECMCVLQGKSLNKDSTDVVFQAAKNTRDVIEGIKGRAHVISAEFAKLFKKLEKERWKHVKSGAIRVTCQIRSLLQECISSITEPTKEFQQQQQLVMGECAKLAQYAEGNLDPDERMPIKDAIEQLLTFLGQSFSQMVDMTLGALVQKMIHTLEEGQSPYSIKTTLNNMVSLGLEGEHMCYLIAREGGIKTLFDVCRRESMQFAHSQALRAVATVCCVAESISELERVGGVECLSDILGELSVPESIRAEAAGVVAQITSPCLEHFQHLAGFIENMDDLVHNLTILCHESSNHEVFLLGAAALANITFMDPMACDFLLQYNSAKVLIQACQLNKAQTVFAKDQVVTVLANMAGTESCCPDIVDFDGTEVLVQLLHEDPPKFGSPAELAACERIQQKAAIALTRLCKEPEAVQITIKLQGIERLVLLCRNSKLRNHSDSVLVACLAALRKMSSATTSKTFKSDDVQQLIQPRLMDSFLICSGMEESFV